MQAACERGATLALHGTCSGSGLRGKLRRRASQNLSRPVCNRVVTKYVACTVSCRQSDSSALRSSWPLHRTRILLASVENVPTSAGSISRKQVACFGLPFSRELTPEEIERGKADLKQGLEEAEEEQKASVKKTKKTKKKKSRSQQDQRVLDAKEQLKTGGAVAFSVEDERGTGVEVISDEFSAESLASTPSFELLVDGSDDGEDGASLDVLQQDEAFYSDLSDEQIAALPDDLLFGTDPTDLQGKAAPRKQADAYVQYYEKYKHLAEEYGDKRLLRRKERGLGSFEAAASSRRARMEIKSERQEYQEELMAQFGANMSANVRKTHKNMRIIAGEAAGFRLLTPRGQNVRPMMEKVRAAVFSSLEAQMGTPGRLPGGRWLDLYSGTGAVGIEAVSRGAEGAHFVELDPWVAGSVLRRNLEGVGYDYLCSMHIQRVEDFLGRCKRSSNIAGGAFDYISVTPPYEAVIYSELLQQLVNSNLIGERTWVIVEYPRAERDAIEETLGPLVLRRDRKYGRTFIAMYGPEDQDLEGF